MNRKLIWVCLGCSVRCLFNFRCTKPFLIVNRSRHYLMLVSFHFIALNQYCALSFCWTKPLHKSEYAMVSPYLQLRKPHRCFQLQPGSLLRRLRGQYNLEPQCSLQVRYCSTTTLDAQGFPYLKEVMEPITCEYQCPIVIKI